ncbi:MAG: protein kinase, partial [Acidobacteriia bacterium]|nr:protein kinase [Terriglobia bacterium]
KPANIKIDPEDNVKILDFGLAKAISDPADPASSDPTRSPTITMGPTVVGTILGTAAYMAPEQARGKKVDRRADIWAFGVVIYEMLTGERLFQGDDAVQVLSRVLEQKLDLDRVPAKFRQLVARCLERNPKDRLRDIGEARFLLDADSGAQSPPAASPPHRQWLPWAAAGVLMLALIALATIHFREQPPDPPKPIRFQFTPANVTITANMRFALSPDGAKLAYFAADRDGTAHLWIRAMDTLESRPLSATGLSATVPLFWSFDSRFIALSTPGKLKKIDISGGPAQTLCDVPGTVIGGSWNRDGVILFSTNTTTPILRVSSEGGAATSVTANQPGELSQLWPVFLPDGRHFLYRRTVRPESSGIYLGSLDDKPDQQSLKRLVATDYIADFVPSPDGNSGEILFLREGTLFAQGFDLRGLKVSGDAVPVAEQVGNYLSVGQFSASRSGALVYRSGAAGGYARLTWLDRHGNTVGTSNDADYYYNSLTVSPDGSRVAAERADGPGRNIWLVDLARVGRTRFTYSNVALDGYPAWSPDGTRIAFSSNRAGVYDLYQRAANGAGGDELLLKSDLNKYVADWSRDGRFLLFDQAIEGNRRELWVLPMDGTGERKPVPFLRTDFDTRSGRFSPDGRWIAYQSNESTKDEIYVRPFPAPAGGGGKWTVSQGGGRQPRWRRDGKELFYIGLNGELMVSEISTSGAAFQSQMPKLLFQIKAPLIPPGWDVSVDGTKFLFPVTSGEATQDPFTVVLNWMALLKK